MASDGDPATDGDVWFRILTDINHIKRGGIHHSAFGGRAIAPPRSDKNRPWSRELSGRLRSVAGTQDDIRQHALEYCANLPQSGGKKEFAGIMYARVSDAKNEFKNVLTTGIHYTPLETDAAHSDLTFDGWLNGDSKDEAAALYMWLQDMMRGLHPPQLEHLPEAISTESVLPSPPDSELVVPAEETKVEPKDWILRFVNYLLDAFRRSRKE